MQNTSLRSHGRACTASRGASSEGKEVGVVFMVEDPRALDPRALGPLVRTLSPGDTDLPGFLAEVQRVRREFHWEARNRRPASRPAGEAAAFAPGLAGAVFGLSGPSRSIVPGAMP